MKPKRPLFIITALLGVTIANSFAGDRPAKAKAEITTAKQTATKAKTEEAIPGADVQPATYFYTGKPYDEDLSGYVFNYRTYSPGMNRWTTADPSGFPDGANSNKYVNAPTFSLDPFGLNTIYQRIEKHYITYSPEPNHNINLWTYYRDLASMASGYFSNIASGASLNEQVRLAVQGVPDNFFDSDDFANALKSPIAGWSESSNEWDYLKWGIKDGPTGPAPDMNKVIKNGEKLERGTVTVRLDKTDESSSFQMKVVEWWTRTVETE